MKHKWLIVLIVTYLIAFFRNLMPSLKYPDSNLTILYLLVTLLLLFFLLLFIIKVPFNVKVNKGIKLFLIAGFLSGIIVYLINLFEMTLRDNVILDVIASIQYPLYLLFTTPLFGLNYLLDINVGVFSLLMSAVYILVFNLLMYVKKESF